MLTKPVESILSAEERTARDIDKAKADAQAAIDGCMTRCDEIIAEKEAQAREISKNLSEQNESQIDEIFKGADIIANDKLENIKNAAAQRQNEAVKCAIEIIAKG